MLVRTKRSIALLLVFLMIVTSVQFMGMPAAYADSATIDDVRTAIKALSADPTTFTTADKKSVETIWTDFQALSSEDQATLDAECTHSDTGQSLGRVLESALWAIWSYETDTSTTLADGTYTTSTSPAVSSESNKGKSDSSRTRNWWVESIDVNNGQATANIYVTSGAATASKLTSYPSVWAGGKTVDRATDNTYPIPVDLNGTTYFGGISSSMPTPIMYSLNTTIEEPEPEPVELAITNKTNMFKAVSASLVEEKDKTYLVMALSGAGYHELYKGTYEQAVANGDGSADAGNDSWIHGYLNTDSKWEFKIPVEENETYMPVVAVSDSYYTKYKNGENDLARAFYPRQVTIDSEAKTIVTDDFNYEAEIAVTNGVTELSISAAKLACVGGPNSNGYKATLSLAMKDDTWTEAFVGTAEEASKADKTNELSDEKVFTIPVRWMETAGQPETITDYANGETFTLSLKKGNEWVEFDVRLSEAEKTLLIDAKSEESALADGVYLLPELAAGPSAMFNHFEAASKMLIVNGDTATVRFITDASTASIQKYSKIALGKSSELVQTNYQAELPEGTQIIEGKVQPYYEGTNKNRYLFEVPLSKKDAEALLANDTAEDIYITIWNKEGSSTDKVPGWYKPSNDIYLSLGKLGEKTTAPAEEEGFRFTLQVGQYVEGADFHTASFEGVTYALKDAAGYIYEPSNATSGMLTYSNLSVANTYTFTASKEGWAVVTQGEWDVDAHAYKYEFTGEDEISVTITKDDAGKNITNSTNPGMIFRIKPRPRNVVDDALELVPEDLTLFTDATVSAVQTAVEAADPTVEDEDKLNAMADAVTKAVQGLVLKDGSYLTAFEHTGKGMFKIIDVVSLDVVDGKMSLHFINGSQTYTKLFVGTTDDANAAAESDLILPGDEATASTGKKGYNWTVPVSALETEIPLAAYSKTKSTFNSTGNFIIHANSIMKKPVELTITNKTTMFKAVSASLVEEKGKTYLVMALSGTGYRELFKGTYEEAVANGDGSADAGNDSWIHGYQNTDGKWEFKIPVEEDETYIPVVAVSNSYYTKYKNGENDLARAFYPRQVTINSEAKTIVTDDFNYEAELAVTNGVSDLAISAARLACVGGPNSNGYKATLSLTMGDDTWTETFIGTAEEAAKAAETNKLSDEKVFTIPVRWMETAGQPETITDYANGETFTLSLKKGNEWVEFDVILSEAEAELAVNADYALVMDVIESLPDPSELKLSDKAAVEDARAQYNALDDRAKARVTNISALEVAEATIAKLEAESALAAANKALETANAALKKANADVRKTNSELEEAKAELEKAKADFDEAAAALEKAKADLDKASADSDKKSAELEKANADLENTKAELEKAMSDFNNTSAELEKANAELAKSKQDAETSQAEIQALKARLKVLNAKVKNVKAKGQKGKAKITWKSAGKGYKYVVYKSSKVSGGFKKAKTASGKKAVIKKLKSGKTYYFKVRAFKTIDGKKVYTQFSDTVGVKIK